MVQEIECLLCEHETLSSNPVPLKKEYKWNPARTQPHLKASVLDHF
jgi:hypothetical protein